MRVLVVDDDELVRDFLGDVLSSGGHTPILASGGREAVRLLEGDGADLVLTDLCMPDQEGFETMKAIRQKMPAMKIVVISGAFGGSMLAMARKLGASATLMKPFSAGEVLSLVESLGPGPV